MPNKHINFTSSSPFAKNGLIDGIATIFDLSGDFYEYDTAKSDLEADLAAIRSDWQMVEQDLSKAYKLETGLK